MILKANQDDFGRIENFTSEQFRHILDLIDGYFFFFFAFKTCVKMCFPKGMVKYI